MMHGGEKENEKKINVSFPSYQQFTVTTFSDIPASEQD